MLVRIGTRGSRLALTQAELAADRLRAEGIEIALAMTLYAGELTGKRLDARLRELRESLAAA